MAPISGPMGVASWTPSCIAAEAGFGRWWADCTSADTLCIYGINGCGDGESRMFVGVAPTGILTCITQKACHCLGRMMS